MSRVALDDLAQVIEQAMAANYAASTRQRYDRGWEIFDQFCVDLGVPALQPDEHTVLSFFAWYGQDRHPRTLALMRQALRYRHVEHTPPLPDPTAGFSVQRFLRGHARLVGLAANRKAPLLVDEIIAICTHLDSVGGVTAIRDKALILLGFGGAFRTGEVAAIDRADLHFNHRAVVVTIPRSKTDQAGEGQEVAINRTSRTETCPVASLEAYLEVYDAHKFGPGPIARTVKESGDPTARGAQLLPEPISGDAFRKLLKRRCEQVGINPDTIGGTSLRAGHVTQAILNGATLAEVAKQGRWKSYRMVSVYARLPELMKNNSSTRLGL